LVTRARRPIQSKALQGSIRYFHRPDAGRRSRRHTAIGASGAKNAALLAVSILAVSDDGVRKKLEAFRKKQTEAVLGQRVQSENRTRFSRDWAER